MTYHRITFVAGPVEQVGIAIDPDIRDVHWLGLDEIEDYEMRSPMVRQCITDAMSTCLPLSFIKHLT